MEKTTKRFLTGMLFGTIAGVIGGILFAPKSGRETRKEIVRYTGEIKDKISEEMAKMSELTKERYYSIVEQVISTYEKARKITSREAEDLKECLGESYERVEDVAKKARKKKSDE